MSETHTETRSERKAREEAEVAAKLAAETGDGKTKIQTKPEPTEAELAEAAAIAEVEAFAMAGELSEKDSTFAKSTAPVRTRKALQLAMDRVAVRAYADWVAAKRPTLWQNMPVVTYFLTPEKVSEYRPLIKKACEVVTPETYTKDGETIIPSGVRVRFGNEFVLSEKQAEKIGKPDKAGLTVLSWAAIDKRNVTKTDK